MKKVYIVSAVRTPMGSFGGASSGKMLQSSLNSAISYGVKQHTGKTPLGHALSYAEEKNPEKKKETCFSFIESTRSEFCTIAKKQIKNKSNAVIEKTLDIAKEYPKNKMRVKSKIEEIAKKSIIYNRR